MKLNFQNDTACLVKNFTQALKILHKPGLRGLQHLESQILPFFENKLRLYLECCTKKGKKLRQTTYVHKKRMFGGRILPQP